MTPNINITEIQLFKALKQKLGEQEAEALVTFVQSEVKAQTEQQATIITKDIAVLREHIDMKFGHIESKFEQVESKFEQMKEGFASKEDLAKTESKLILWAFAFWATQLGAMFAFLKFLLK